MSSTNKTSHYELSQFIGTDKPAWLTDYNGDMLKIDTGLAAAAAEASGAQGTATSAASAAQAAQNTANQAVTSAAANAEDITELKGALTNTVDEMSLLGNASTGYAAITYSDYLQIIKFYCGWTELPNNTAIYDTLTRIPLFSIAGNIFKIEASTITDGNSKINCAPITIRAIASGETIITNTGAGIYYDGNNTILYAQMSTENYSSYSQIYRLWGQIVIAFSGNFINDLNEF